MSSSTNEKVNFLSFNFVRVIFGKRLITAEFLISCQTANAEICAQGKMVKRRVVPAEQLIVTVLSYVYVEVKENHA